MGPGPALMIWDGPGFLNRHMGRARVIEKCLIPSRARGQPSPDTATVDPSSFNLLLGKAERVALRKALEEGEHAPRPSKASVTGEPRMPVGEDQIQTWINKLDRIIRWNTFLTHTAINAHEQINSDKRCH